MSTEQPQVGWWAYVCCEEDLYQIEDEADLAERLDWDEEDGLRHTYFPTREEALAHIASNADDSAAWPVPSGGEGTGQRVAL